MSEDEAQVETIELTIPSSQEGQRLDRALGALLPDVSRSLVQKHITQEAVWIDGALPKRGAKTTVHAGEQIRYSPPPPQPLNLVSEPMALELLFEDEHLMVINKPPNLVVHPALGHPSGTLLNGVLHHLRGFGNDAARPGIVHRLDRDTTGAIAVAKTPLAHERLSTAFQAHEIHKVYLAVTFGHPEPAKDTIDTFYARHSHHRQKFSSKVHRGKRAITHYEVLERYPSAALVQVNLQTGRTHQIRVHLADRGHPLLGDQTYGRAATAKAFTRQALHARQLSFQHPIKKTTVSVTAPIPEDLQALIEALKSETP